MVLCAGGKNQVQPLERARPVLPLAPSAPERRIDDYERHDANTPIAALAIATGTATGEVHRRHGSTEFLQVLHTIEANVSPVLDIHLVMDNDGTIRPSSFRIWLALHPRLHGHFAPTAAS